MSERSGKAAEPLVTGWPGQPGHPRQPERQERADGEAHQAVSGRGLPHRLTTDEVALVLRRAVELEAEAAGSDPTPAFDATVVIDAAEEVGLSPIAVRQALAELQTGALPALRPGATRRAQLIGPSSVVESRVVACSPDQVFATIDQFFRRRSFDQRRRQGSWAIYRERHDLLRHVRRVVDSNGARQLLGVSGVTVTVSPLAGAGSGSVVRVEATLHPAWRGLPITATGYGVVAVTGVAAVATGDPAALLVGAPLGAAMTAGGWGRRRRWRRRRGEEVGEVLAALLDRLQ